MQNNLKSRAVVKTEASKDDTPATDSARTTNRKKAGRQPDTSAQSNPTSSGRASKQAKVIELLSRKDGASVAAIMKLTGWQKHSVHGFFAGVVRKKLQLNLVRIGEGDKAAYRIASGTSGAPKAGKAVKRAKAAKSVARKSSGKRAR